MDAVVSIRDQLGGLLRALDTELAADGRVDERAFFLRIHRR